ncbi:MAG: hypothetical protein MR522_06065, partial [Trueperella sp.]|nr:hypothetical protein [Trueperella sp.]
IDSREKLIACRMSEEEIRQDIDADSLGYLSIEDARRMAEPAKIGGFCTACFDGNYPTKVSDPEVSRYKRTIRTGVLKDEETTTMLQVKEVRP